MSGHTVRLIIDEVNRKWIIGKMAVRLAEALVRHGFEAEISDGPREDVDINHWMLYLQPWNHYYKAPGFFEAGWRPSSNRHTAMITHIDDPLKLQIVREAMNRVLDVGICMSRMTRDQLISEGIDARQLMYINPAHDGGAKPRRIVVGITSRLYGDRRKREQDLLGVAAATPLDAFRFEIFGSGWEGVAAGLRAAGAEVDLSGACGDYSRLLERLPTFDYYLYLGWDEGSMGILDALAAGVKTIVTPQGFHVDLRGGITHSFRDVEELTAIFDLIRSERQLRIDSVGALTWDAYARRHASVWRALLEGKRNQIGQLADETTQIFDYEISTSDLAAARRRAYRRTLTSEFWPFFIESRKFWVRGKLSKIKRFLLGRPSRL